MLEGLDPQQLKAVESEHDTLLLACPGSGKTRVLTRKIAYELDRLESNKKFIVALTYTNRAADEIQKRIDEMGIPQEQLWAGTIHSFCYQWIIKPYAELIPALVNGFTILDEFKKETILKELKTKHSLPSYQAISTSITRDGKYTDQEPVNKMVAKEYHKSIVENKEIDFDLILYLSYRLLKKNKKIRRHLSRLFRYIFVDEYQDTSDLQYGIIGQIIRPSEGSCNIFLVGDPDQSIYSSLGGIPRTLEEIQDEISSKHMELHKLSGNYRSSQRIVDYSVEFQYEDMMVKALGEYSNKHGRISLNTTIDKEDVPQEVANLISYYIEKGCSPNEICVIAPQWYSLYPVAKKLRALLPGVPFEAPGSIPLPKNKDNFWWKLARLFLTEPNPQNSLNRFRWVRRVIEDLNDYTNEGFTFTHNDCRRYLKWINSIKPRPKEGVLYLKEAFKEFFNKLEIDFTHNQTLHDQWETFFNGIKQRYETESFADVPNTIDYFRGMFKPSSGVVINTCHGVKGEEYETVIAFGLLWGYIPHWNAIWNEPPIVRDTSSKNLLYVISSRAKENLHLLAETGRSTTSGYPYEINRHLANVRFEYDALYV
ncbi:ATP-dependent helicase [Rossellomorea sp. YZS02]|uniref:ATP-dependent helicase n=1 Tax=Rossellomorea sp. YZS02 TaxID=3097358 RepID=UPI002A0CDB5C|nr:ATP-dependent helicase [Rossellomorea sp. YZS02]MDX8345805.1 ATP-dependent helicase [Rossellomorea sp. YZS02]